MKQETNNKKINKSKVFIFLTLILTTLSFIGASFATLDLQHIQFDPAVVSAGDEVDIIIQFKASPESSDTSRIGDGEYTFKVELSADDDLTKNYIRILDSQGDDKGSTLLANELYNKVFRVKVKENAPVGSYEFKLSGTWYKDGQKLDYSQDLKFKIPVKKEGIALDISTISTKPGQVRPGDKFVQISAFLENSGEKEAKSVELNLKLPENFQSSYTNNNRNFVGFIGAHERKQIDFFINLDDNVNPQVYDFKIDLKFKDLEENTYQENIDFDFLVKSRPYLEIIKVEGQGISGKTTQLKVWVKNTGTQSAQSTDLRIIKQNAQPFEIDVRSDYIGELEANQTGLAIFDIKTLQDASIKNHSFDLIIRSKGDSDEGDENIYTYSRKADFEVTGKAPNYLVYIGIFGLLIALALIIFKRKK